jgi:hypothetical protein
VTLLTILCVLAVAGIGFALYRIWCLSPRLDAALAALRALEAALAESQKATTAILENLPGLVAIVSNARTDVQRVADGQTALMGQNKLFGEFLDHAIEELREERRKREEPPADGWKAGEVALGRMARTRQVFADLEEASLRDLIASELK